MYQFTITKTSVIRRDQVGKFWSRNYVFAVGKSQFWVGLNFETCSLMYYINFVSNDGSFLTKLTILNGIRFTIKINFRNYQG